MNIEDYIDSLVARGKITREAIADKIEALKAALPPSVDDETVMLALAELAESQASSKLETQLAIAELAELMMTGGGA